VLKIKDHLTACPGVWRGCPPAKRKSLDGLAADSQFPLPPEYLEFLRCTNGGEGDLAVQPYWICFWPAEEVLTHNARYSVGEFAPGFFGIGSNGGGELIALDTRSSAPYPVVAIPFIPLDPAESLNVSASFRDLVPLIGVPCVDETED
jgi:hypothetical protein